MGDNPILVGLTLNATMLLAMVLITELSPRSFGSATGLRSRLFAGLLVATFATVVMLAPVVLTDGLIFDVRSVVLSLSGLFFGVVPTVIAVGATSVVRWVQGGIGAPFGIALIVASGTVGVLWRRWRGGSLHRLGALELYGFGLVVHAIMIAIMSSLPAPLADAALREIAGPVLVILPVATLITGRLLVIRIAEEVRRAERLQREVDLRLESERNERRISSILERLDLFLQHAPASLAMFDRDLCFTAVSRRWIDDFELDGVDVLGRYVYDVFPELPPHYRQAHQRALRGEVVRSDEDRLVRVSGKVMWQRWEVRPWFGDDGEIGGMIVFAEDITASVESRHQLMKLSRAVEQSPESIVITNVDAEIEFVNEAAVEASGFTRAEMIGENPRIFNSGSTPPETYREMWATLAQGRTWRGEFVNRRKDGSTYIELATISPVRDQGGEVTHYVGVKQDVTEQKRVERELEEYRADLERLVAERTSDLADARAKADVANKAKSAFLASMSHEIRTPLNAIVGLTHLLLRDDPTEHQRDRLAKVDRSAEHLLSIVNDVLDVAKIEAGKMALDDHDFHLSAVLDHVHSMIAGSAEAKGLTVEIDRHHVPLWLRGDAARLRQALLNFAANAVKFTERGSIRLSSDLVDESDDGLTVRFEVEDTGVGIEEDVLASLFEVFEQGDTSTARDRSGTGLGLAITRRLAELMGGEAGAESTPGVGTRVWFTCTLQRGQGVMPKRAEMDMAGTDPPIVAEDDPFEGKRVLLAEDNPINLEVATDLLHGFGLDVDVAATGREAVERAREHAYDLILLDVHMPEMNGLDATREIRSRSANVHVPILAMTANAFEDDRKACFAAGMNDFLAKPVDPPTLRSKLADWLSRAPVTPEPQDSGEAETRRMPWQWDGLNADVGIAVVDGDEAHYLRLLRRFAAAHAQDAHRLRRDMSAGNIDAARQRAHALKGVAGTVGAWRLFDAAHALELGLRSGETPDPSLAERVGAELGELVERISELPAPEADHVPSAAMPVAEVVARLRSLLDVNSPEAVNWQATHRATLRRAYGADADALAAAVERYDFAAARAELERLSRGGE